MLPKKLSETCPHGSTYELCANGECVQIRIDWHNRRLALSKPLGTGLEPDNDPDHPMLTGMCVDDNCKQTGPRHLHNESYRTGDVAVPASNTAVCKECGEVIVWDSLAWVHRDTAMQACHFAPAQARKVKLLGPNAFKRSAGDRGVVVGYETELEPGWEVLTGFGTSDEFFIVIQQVRG